MIKCYLCGYEIKHAGENEYFTWFRCTHCNKLFCRAKDSKETWSFLHYPNDEEKNEGKNRACYVECTKEMIEENREIPEVVTFS